MVPIALVCSPVTGVSDRDSIRQDWLSQVETPSFGRMNVCSRIHAAKMPTMTKRSFTRFFRSTVCVTGWCPLIVSG